MKKILNNKRLLIVIGVSFIIILITSIILRNYIYKKCAEEAQIIYNQVHELYYYGGNIEFSTDDNNERISIEKDKIKYYQISNYNESVKKYFTDNKLKLANEFLNIINENNSYYMKDIGRGISNYYETTIVSKRIGINKRTFIAKSRFCKINHQVNYGDGCEGKNEYTIKEEFILVRVNKKWKVDKYTSIFEFGNKIK